MEVTVNLNGVFAQINDAKELKETAQNIVEQINTAYQARLAELMPKKNAPAVVDATPSTKGKKSAPTKIKRTKGEFDGVPEADAAKTASKKSKSAKDTAKSEPKTTTKDTAKSAKPAKVEQVKISSLTKAQVKAMNIHFEEYSEKCMLMIGETKSIKDDIKANGWARWYSRAEDERKGWMVNKEYAATLAKALKIKLA